MPKKIYRKAIFSVVYSISNKKIEYLLLKRKLHWKGWEFVKGKIENSETKIQAVKRETKEETGLNFISIRDFKIHGRYKYKNKLKDRQGIIGQTYHLFATQVRKGKVKLDEKEHSGYIWLEYEKAIKKLTWRDQRKCLKIVNDWLLKENKKIK